MLEAARAFIARTTPSRSPAPAIFRRKTLGGAAHGVGLGGGFRFRRGWNGASARVAISRIAFRSASLNLSADVESPRNVRGISAAAFRSASSASFTFSSGTGSKRPAVKASSTRSARSSTPAATPAVSGRPGCAARDRWSCAWIHRGACRTWRTFPVPRIASKRASRLPATAR